MSWAIPMSISYYIKSTTLGSIEAGDLTQYWKRASVANRARPSLGWVFVLLCPHLANIVISVGETSAAVLGSPTGVSTSSFKGN